MFKIYKFGDFCSYTHVENTEDKLKKEVEKLTREVHDLETKNQELLKKIEQFTVSLKANNEIQPMSHPSDN